MRLSPFLTAAALIAATALGGCEPAVEANADQPPPAAEMSPVPQGSGFDFYVLSLSWSPSYCETEGAEANQQQCGSTRPYAFVVHGLWPQFEHDYPEYCPTRRDRVPDALVATLLDIMPSAGLIGHQWRKHGSCSGLSQADYFAVTRAARDRIAVPERFRRPGAAATVDPDEVEKDFIAANPGLATDGIAVSCDDGYLREVRICMDKALGLRACREIDRKSCRSAKLLMPPVSGG